MDFEFTLQSLELAWQKVLANDAADGTLNIGITRFARDLDERLEELFAELDNGTYQPRDLVEVRIPKHGGERILRVKLATVLEKYGDRIQKSVFLIGANQQELAEITARAEALIDVNTDSLWLMQQCATCWETATLVGQAEPPQRSHYWAVM